MDPSILPSLKLTKDWAYYQLKKYGYSKCKATKSARKLPRNSGDVKAKFLDAISNEVVKHDIPPCMVVNWDQTAVPMVPVSQWTMNHIGEKQVTMAGLNDKRQITALLTISACGTMLPPQVCENFLITYCFINTIIKFMKLFLSYLGHLRRQIEKMLAFICEVSGRMGRYLLPNSLVD